MQRKRGIKMIYGYARVSTQDQNLDSQVEQLLKYGVDEIIKEKISGISKNKQLLDELISKLTPEDTLVVTRMDRLGRNTVQLGVQPHKGISKQYNTDKTKIYPLATRGCTLMHLQLSLL